MTDGRATSFEAVELAPGEFLHSWLVPRCSTVPHPNCASKPAEINPRWRLNAPDDPVPITLNEIQKGLRFLLLKVTTSRQIDVLSKDPPRTSKKSRGNYSAEAAVCIAEALRKLRRRLSNLSIAEADAYLALHRSLNLRVKMKANVCLFVYSHRLACQIFSRNKMIGESKSVKFARGKARLLRPFWSQTVGLTEALLPSFKLCLGAVSILLGGLILYESSCLWS